MKYKIQTNTLWGWADLKFSEDGSTYQTELFDSKKDANGELDEILIATEDSKELYRIVEDSIQEETNLYH
jgi:hypothetical protein